MLLKFLLLKILNKIKNLFIHLEQLKHFSRKNKILGLQYKGLLMLFIFSLYK